MVDTALLPGIAIFGGLSPEEVAVVSGLLEERTYASGAIVVEEGTPGRELFVIVTGSAVVVKRAADGSDRELTRLGPGACFGEMALVGIMRRTATVRAESALAVAALPYAAIGRLAHEHARTFTLLVMNLARELCRRLEKADAVLADFGDAAAGAAKPAATRATR